MCACADGGSARFPVSSPFTCSAIVALHSPLGGSTECYTVPCGFGQVGALCAHYERTTWALRAHYVGTACNANTMSPSQGGKGGNHPTFMQASQGSSYPWWLVAEAKHYVLLRECDGRWWQPSGNIGILP